MDRGLDESIGDTAQMNDEVKGYVMADKDAIEEYARIVAQAIHQAHDQHNETAVLDPVEYLTVDQEIRGLAIQAACSFGDTGGLRTALLRADLIAQYIKTGEIRIEGTPSGDINTTRVRV